MDVVSVELSSVHLAAAIGYFREVYALTSPDVFHKCELRAFVERLTILRQHIRSYTTSLLILRKKGLV